MKLRHQLSLVLLLVGLAQGEEYVTRQRRTLRGEHDHHEPGAVDIHSGEHCVDVSFWGNVTYEFDNENCCETTLQKQCKSKQEKVCAEVTNLECDVLAYTECDLVMTTEPFTTDKMVEDEYQVWECDEGVKNVTHLKKLPDCQNVTRMNCVQLWETDSRGQKVKKNVDCKPVTWQECKLVDIYKNLEVPDVNCYQSNTVPYNKCQKDVPQDFMVTRLVCEVKHKVTCVPKVLEKCSTVRYRECTEVPSRNCGPKRVQKPKQEYIHQEVCLLGGEPVPTHPGGPRPRPRPGSGNGGGYGRSGTAPLTIAPPRGHGHGGDDHGKKTHHYPSLTELKNRG